MAKTSAIPGWQLALLILTGTVVGVVVVTCLYWAQTVFIPVALAVFLTFLLAPLVTALQRRGLRRLPSVLLVVMLAAAVLGGVVWLVTAQVTSLAGEVPKYTENIKDKVKSLRHLGQGSVTSRLEKMIQDITGAWNRPAASQEGEDGDKPAVTASEKPTTKEVMIRGENIRNSWLAACRAHPDRHGGRRGRGHLSVLGADGFHPGRAGGVPDLSAGSAHYGPSAAWPEAIALGNLGRHAGSGGAGRRRMAGHGPGHEPGRRSAEVHGEYQGQGQIVAASGPGVGNQSAWRK